MKYRNLASAVAMSLGMLATPLTFANLVAYYPFNGNANDESGNGFDGTVSGATLTTDRFNNADSAYFFDGQNDYIKIASGPNLQGASQTTLVAWVKSDPNKGEDCSRIIEIGTFYTNSTGLVLDSPGCTTTGMARAWIHADGQRKGGVNSQGDGINYNDDTWHFLAFTYDGSTTKLYIDGILKHNNTANGAIDSVSSALIGAHNLSSPNVIHDNYFGGVIDDVGVYNHVLSECEIQSLYTGKDECHGVCVLNFDVPAPNGWMGYSTLNELGSWNLSVSEIMSETWEPVSMDRFLSCYERILPSNLPVTAENCAAMLNQVVPAGTVLDTYWFYNFGDFRNGAGNCQDLRRLEILPKGVKLLATGVELEASKSEGQVDLTLTTSSENETAQLLILRGEKLENGGTLIKPVCQFKSGGSPYSCTDDTVGDTYRAAEREYDGDLIVYEEVKAKKAKK